MIEKIMKSIKSNNKKRGRNITIGAVVGFLLSCTSVMGADVIGLDITQGAGGEILFQAETPFPDNTFDGDTYTNNTTITGTTTSGNGYGIKLSLTDKTISILNNGNISGKGDGSSIEAGIWNTGKINTLTNRGIISGGGNGISNSSGTIATLRNIGIISGGGSNGIYNSFGTIDILRNIGIISGSNGISNPFGTIDILRNIGSINSGVCGISNLFGTIDILRNIGSINGGSDGISNSLGTIGILRNIGIINGGSDGISNSSGTINYLNNYGIIAGKISAISGNASDKIEKYGLVFTTDSGYTLDSNYSGEFGTIYKDVDVVVDYEKDINGHIDFTKPITENYTIVNVNATVDNGSQEISDIKSLVLNNGKLSYGGSQEETISSSGRYILNGITDTLEVIGNGNKINNSIINGYKGAVLLKGNSSISLNNTIVNSATDSAISVKGDNNEVALSGNTIINGEMTASGIGNSLNFNRDINTNREMNILHNISGFNNMNINANVTLFEKTVDKDGKSRALKVSGAGNITIGAGGVLTLRIDATDKDSSGDIKGHALHGNDGTISSTGGKILLALNGAGNTQRISFGSTILDDSIKATEDASIKYQEDFTVDTASWFHSAEVDRINNSVIIVAKSNLPLYGSIPNYKNLNKIYQSIISIDKLGDFLVNKTNKEFSIFLGYLNDIYAGNPYSYSSELSRKSTGMFRDIVTENQFRADTGKWLIHGGLTHIDGGTKDTYYGKGYYTYDVGSSDIDADTKITGAYILGEYGISDTLTSGVVIGGNKLKSDLSNGSKVEGSAIYLGAYAKKYLGNLKVTAGAGFQYGDYDADRLAVNNVASEIGTPVMKYSDNYNDITYDIYINGRYSHNIGENLFLEPYGTLSYTYVNQDGADEGNKSLAIETDSKSFDYTTAKVGIDLKKVIPHEKGKSTLSAGVSYTRILDGADEEFITGRFKGGTDFDILVAHKNEHSIGLNAKYSLELENGILFDVKGTYAVERDSYNQSGKNKTKDEWIVGAGLGYKF